jgi:hypothetical protein
MAELFGEGYKNRARLLDRLDHLVGTGQVTEEEAQGLRRAEDPQDFDAAVVAIRTRHAQARLDAAVAAGQMSKDEADANLARIRAGEHPRGLRAHLGRLARHR